MFIAATHNGISRLYETFGNGGSADTQDRTLSADETSRTWYRQNPPLPFVKWSLRNNNNYEMTGLIVSLNHIANNRVYFLRNFYDKSKRSILKAQDRRPGGLRAAGERPAAGRAGRTAARAAEAARRDFARDRGVHRAGAGAAGRGRRTRRPAAARAAAAGAARRAGAAAARAGAGGAAGAARRGDAGGAGAPAPPRTEPREFPAGSYIIRMDQPYSRIADALLDYQYWSPNDPQSTPYDDTGWTFPEGFGVQAVRVLDPKVLDAPMTLVSGAVTAPSGVTGTPATGLRHQSQRGQRPDHAALQAARARTFRWRRSRSRRTAASSARGSFIIRNVSQADLDAADEGRGPAGVRACRPRRRCATHPARAARVALMHTWQSTQTEGWWRQALDFNGIPYDYISVQDVAKNANLREKYDVILFGPGAAAARPSSTACRCGAIRCRGRRRPTRRTLAASRRPTTSGPGLGWQGLMNLDTFVKQGGVYVGAVGSAQFAIQFGLTDGVSANAAGTGSRVVGSLLRTRLVDDTSPIVYGIPDNLAVYSDSGGSFSVSATAGGRGGGGGGGAAAAAGGRGGGAGPRATGRGTPDDPDQAQGMPQLSPKNQPPPRPAAPQPWQYAIPTEEQMRTPLNIIPPDQRPRVALRFADQNQLLVSGLLQGGGDIAQRPVVVDVPVEKGHVVLFANNPIWRGETIGSYGMVWNAILNFDNLNAGRKLDAR